MNKLNIEQLQKEYVTLNVEDEPDGNVRLILSGELDLRNPYGEILPYFIAFHEAVIKAGLKWAYLDITKLTFMNSSGIQTLISWMMKINDVPDDERYRIKIIYDSNIMWQGSSIPVFKRLLKDILDIECIT